METLEFILVIIAAYVMGSLSISIFMSSHVLGRDIRRAGSGNAGATNMARVYGMSAGVLTLGGDMCKTAAAMLLGYLVLGDRGMAAAGMACMAGHCYPLLHGFKGGKGVSAGAAIALCIDWRAGLLTIAVFAIAVLCSKKVSFGSICAALSLPVWALVLELSQPRCALAIVGMCLVVIWHRENIKRLISGTEPDFKPGKSKRIERD